MAICTPLEKNTSGPWNVIWYLEKPEVKEWLG